MNRILAALVLLLIPTFAHADAWVLWGRTTITTKDNSSDRWSIVDAYESLRACKDGARPGLFFSARKAEKEPRELNAGYEYNLSDAVTHSALCLPAGTNPVTVRFTDK